MHKTLPWILLVLSGCGRQGDATQEFARSMGVRCDSCGIQLTLDGQITEPAVDAEVRRSTRISVRSDGMLIVAPLGDRDHIGVADPTDGRTKSFGRSGDGPGEFRRLIAAVPTGGDSLLVLSERHLMLFSPSLAFVRSARVPGQLSAVLSLAPDRIVATSYAPHGRPFLLLDGAFHELRWLGDSSGASDSLEYRVTGDGEGGFWAAQTLAPHRVLRYDSSGTKLADWIPDPSWDPVPSGPGDRLRDPMAVRPVTRLNGLYYDAENARLWFAGLTADRDWKPLHKPGVPGREGPATARAPEVPLGQLYDGFIEVRDARSGSVIASRRLPEPVGGLADNGLLFAIHEDPHSGSLSLLLFLPELERGYSGSDAGTLSATPED